MSEPLLRVELDAGYGKQQILRGVEFDLAKGETLGLLGGSGAGKSTLILALLGLLSWRRGWAKGDAFFEGQNIIGMKEQQVRQLRGRRIALIPQSPSSALNGSLKLITHFEEAWRAHRTGSRSELASRLKMLMEQVGLPSTADFLSRKPAQISVGQAQRILIALALLHRPALIIADEPTSALDAGNRLGVMDLLRNANLLDETALLYISHDLLSVLQLCQRIAVLHDGQIVESLPVCGIEEQANHPATVALLRSLPIPAGILHTFKHTARSKRSATLAVR
jgi:ABC-type glutathione transport system ATPase component